MHSELIYQLIPVFNGNNIPVEKFIKMIEIYRKTYRWTDAACLIYAISRLKGSAKEWQEAQDEGLDTYASFRESIVAYFHRKVDLAEIHMKLSNIVVEKNQSYESFATHMLKIGKTANVDEKSIIRYILRGISREKIYDSVVNFSYDSIMQLIDRIKDAEVNLRLKHKQYTERRNLGYQDNRPIRGSDRRDVRPASRCYNCGESRHKFEKRTNAIK